MSSELIEACRELLAMPLMCRWSKETDGLFVPALERARAAIAAIDRPAPVEGEYPIFDANMHDDADFVEAWRGMEARGYMYGDDALENVHLGYCLARHRLAHSAPKDAA